MTFLTHLLKRKNQTFSSPNHFSREEIHPIEDPMHHRKIIYFSFFWICFFSIFHCQKETREKILGKPVLGAEAQPATLEEIAPLSTNALGARKELHKKGWKVIPSSEKNLKIMGEASRQSAKHAVAAIVLKKGDRLKKYPGELGSAIRDVRSWGVSFEEEEKQTRQKIRENSILLAKKEWQASRSLLRMSRERLILGYVSYFERTEEDFRELRGLPGEYYQDLKTDFSNIYRISSHIREENTTALSTAWTGAIENGLKEYKDAYDKSGERGNSLLAVFDILGGYTVALSEFLLRPIGTTFMSTGEILLWDGVILPISTSSFFAGRTVASTGMSLYYTSKLGVKTISPTIEAGFLSAFSLVSASATVPTIVGGEGLRAFNQVTVVVGTETARTAGTVGAIGYKSGEVVLGMGYDFGKDTTISAVYGLKSGIVLGYTALTVIPTHLILSAPDSVFFLAWDGPRLVVARARGNLKEMGNLPAGTIVDLEKAKQQGMDVEVISDDPEVIQNVIQAQDKDLDETSP